ncbi:MAG TPA: LemA family protein [Thermoanaerobaculia bacterium]|nr:LemA family protein [Thermoanaerobaculia bacterium]HUM28982.1 LemA family protein [Thermoanaerobaculia bacterium]HXK67086.1 LemA family protein [Thermoanaerobaculia bacterium]
MGTVLLIVLVLVIVIVGGGMVGLVVGMYNSLIQVRNNVQKAWNNIDVLLQQRHDELTKLIDTAIAYVEHERETFDHIVKLRTDYDEVRTIAEKVGIENTLNDRLKKIQMVWEQYPQLRAVESFLQVQDRVSSLESQISDRREFFNDSVNIYNIQIERLPEVLLAKLLGYQRFDYLRIPTEKKEDVEMKFEKPEEA